MTAQLARLRREAMHRQARGFSTIVDEAYRASDLGVDQTTTANTSVVSFQAFGEPLLVTYDKTGKTLFGDYDFSRMMTLVGVGGSGSRFLSALPDFETTTAQPEIVPEPIELHERGVMVIRTPREHVFTAELKIRMADVKRRSPKIVLSRTFEGDNA